MSVNEETLAGMVLRDPTCLGRAQISIHHLEDLAVRSVWKAFEELEEAGIEIDELAVADHMSDNALHAVGGLAGLSKLSGAILTTANLEYHAGKVRDAYLSREVRCKASEILHANSEATGADLLSMLSTSESALRGSLTASHRTLATAVGEEFKAVVSGSERPLGVPTSLGVDRWFPGGLPLSKVATLFADTGTYKTTTVNQFMFGAAEAGYKGLLFPLEDGDELTAHRWMSRKTGVHYGRIAGGICNAAERQRIGLLTPGDWAKLENIRSCDGIEPRIEHIIREVAAAKAVGGLDFVVVDYMQLLEGKGNQQEVITNAMRRSANAAKRYKVCWIWVSQQNEKSKDRKDPRPQMQDCFGSNSMKQASKTMLALFRPHEFWPKPQQNHPLHGMYWKLIERMEDTGREMYENMIELWCVKNIFGKKRSMQLLVAKPEQGILDPITTEGWL